MLEQKIFEDYKNAMKQKDTIKTTVLSSLRAEFKYLALDKKKDILDDAECIVIIKKIIKQHQDSIEQFTSGNRLDLVEKEQKELILLKSYLPEEMSAQEVAKIVDEVVVAVGALGMKDMGKVMKEVMLKTAGKADGKIISDSVKQRLMNVK